MSTIKFPLLFLAGLAAGLIDAIAGGGGIVTIPVLLGIGMQPQTALGTNKLQSTLARGAPCCILPKPALWTSGVRGRNRLDRVRRCGRYHGCADARPVLSTPGNSHSAHLHCRIHTFLAPSWHSGCPRTDAKEFILRPVRPAYRVLRRLFRACDPAPSGPWRSFSFSGSI